VNDKAALGSNSTQFVSYDGNGNVSALVDAGSGNETARYEYGPFGDLTQASGLMARANPIRFSSKYHDDYTGLIYYGYRYYSPTFQRWLNRDPLGEEGGLNLYGFVENDPVNGFDPLGLDPSMNQLFWTSVYDNGRSDAGRFLKRGGKGAAQMGIGMAKQIYGTMLNPLGSAYDGYQSLANMYQSTANLGAYLGKLSAEPCERQRALNALQNYAASPEAYADATLFIESLLAGRLMAPEAAAARIGSFADDAARIEIAAAKGIAKIDDGIPLTGITRFDQPAVEAQHFGRFLDLVREQGFKPRPYGGLTEARAQFRGNGLFVYNPNTMTVMDMLHEIKHIQQFRRSGFNPFSNPLTEPQAYNFERFLLRDQPNVNPAYLEYLQGMPK
jgi:RHS repeat-associated protein